MNEEITASSTYDVMAMRAAYRWHQHAKGMQRALKWMLPFVAAVGAYAVIQRTGSDRVMGAGLLCLVVFVVLMSLLERYIVERSVKSSPACGAKIGYRFTEVGFSMQAPGIESSLSWSQVMETKLTSDGALIYLQRLMFHWLPKTAFTSEADYNRFLGLLTAKTKHAKIG